MLVLSLFTSGLSNPSARKILRAASLGNFPRPCKPCCRLNRMEWGSRRRYSSLKAVAILVLKNSMNQKKLEIGSQRFAGSKAIIVQVRKLKPKDIADQSNALSPLVVQQEPEPNLTVQAHRLQQEDSMVLVSWIYTGLIRPHVDSYMISSRSLNLQDTQFLH